MKIVEVTGGSTTSTKQFVRGGAQSEERDGSGNLVKQFFGRGQKNGSISLFYTTDHLASARELTDVSGAIQAQYGYSPYGESTIISQSIAADFGYIGIYNHARSGFALAIYRVYAPRPGRWLSRDPLGEQAGTNFFSYAENDPVNFFDRTGLMLSGGVSAFSGTAGAFSGGSWVPLGSGTGWTGNGGKPTGGGGGCGRGDDDGPPSQVPPFLGGPTDVPPAAWNPAPRPPLRRPSPFIDCLPNSDPECCKNNWETCTRYCRLLYSTRKEIRNCQVCCQQVFERCKNNPPPFRKENWHECFPGFKFF